MKCNCIITFVTAVLMMLSAQAQTMSDCTNLNVSDPKAELVFHTAAPGIIASPNFDMSKLVTAYDITLIPREGWSYMRWGHLDENGEGLGFWTKWRDYDGTMTFDTPGIYVLQAYSQAPGKDISSIINITFKVDYMGMTTAPSITMEPYGERGYYVSLSSAYDTDIYYRWKIYESESWNNWHLYTEAIPFTETGIYVLEANSDDDPLAAYIVVPGIDYWQTGDVDYNGAVNMDDLTALTNMLLNPEILIGTGDVNRDGTVGMDDLTELTNMLIKAQR